MTPYVTKLIKEKGRAIKCEAEMSEGEGHSGLIVLVEEDQERAILGRTDPTFKSAKAAVDAMKDTVDTIRNGKPEPEVEEEQIVKKMDAPGVDFRKPKKEVKKKKPRKPRKSRKRKGVSDG